MKRIYTIILLMAVVMASASAQGLQSRKSVFKTKRVAKSAQVQTKSASLRSVQPFETQFADSAITFNGSTNEAREKSVFSIDEVSKGIIENTHYHGGNEGWVNNGKTITVYNNDGLITSKINYYINENGIFIPSSKYIDTYYKGDKIASDEYYDYDENASTWILTEKSESSYNAEGYFVSRKYYSDEDGDGRVELVEESRADYVIDSEGYADYIVYLKPAGTDDSMYELAFKNKIKYNENDLLIYVEDAEWYNDKWNDPRKDVYEYNNGKLVSEMRYAYDDETAAWLFSYGEKYTYDSKNNLTLIEKMDGENVNEYVKYYYSDVSGIESGKVSNNNVTFANGVLTVSSTYAETVSVYSVTGVQLYSFDKNEGEASANISNIAQGIVIVKGSTGWAQKALVK